MASIKKINDRKFKITISNGYTPQGKKIAKAKTIDVPKSVQARSIMQYVHHEAEEFEREVKLGYSEDGEMTFEEYSLRGSVGRQNMPSAPSMVIANYWSVVTHISVQLGSIAYDQ